jgi:hypothetical protein
MPRLSLQPRSSVVVEQLAHLQGQINQCRRDVLGYAREAGDILRSVPSKERATVAIAAGITGRRTPVRVCADQ